MEVVFERCCGLDIHKQTITACVITPGPGGGPRKEVQSFGTYTGELLRLADWLSGQGVTHVAMESTGVYWKPVYNLLESSFTLLLVNARHVKAVPGRKTDVNDCAWLADLLRHGLLRASFVPDRPQRELRELTRYRSSLVREHSAEVNRLQKTLEGANIKLASVLSDITGVSGRAMVDALAGGSSDAEALAELAVGKARNNLTKLQQALAGMVGAHQRFLIARQLAHMDFLSATIEELDREVAERMRPFAAALERLDAVPGIGQRTAEVLVAELGTDMGQFPTAAHLASWAGMAPGNNESAGKRRSGKTTKGNRAVRVALTEAARAAARAKGSYLAARHARLVVRLGTNKATVAVGHTILTIVHHLLKAEDSFYRELGAHYYDQRDSAALERRLIRKLEQLGNQVTCERLTTAET